MLNKTILKIGLFIMLLICVDQNGRITERRKWKLKLLTESQKSIEMLIEKDKIIEQQQNKYETEMYKYRHKKYNSCEEVIIDINKILSNKNIEM